MTETFNSPAVDRDVLRDHGQAERVERVWQRLDQSLPSAPARKTSRTLRIRWQLAAVALGAGFLAGLSFGGGWLSGAPAPSEPELPAAANRGAREVFAAGTARQAYALPGGGEIELMPETIVDTVAADSEGLTLRLLRGEATMSTISAAGERATRLTLRIGRAVVSTGAGSLRVRLEGRTAQLQVLDGSATVASPSGNGLQHQLLGPNQSASVPVLMRSAHTTPPTPTHTKPQGPWPPREPSAKTEAPATQPAWMTACDQADYSKAYELLQSEQGGVGKALGNIKSPKHLMCISSGSELRKNSKVAKQALERVVTKFANDPRGHAVTAAHNLARIHGREGDKEQAARYAKLQDSLSNSLSEGSELLSADALCKKIETEAANSQHAAVLRLADRYRTQFPGGSCTNKIEQLVAEATTKSAAATKPGADGGADDPYDPDSDPAKLDAGQQADNDEADDTDEANDGETEASKEEPADKSKETN